MRRFILELILAPLCVMAIISAYMASLESSRSAYEALVVESSELAFSAPRFLLDFLELELVARRVAMGDESLREGQFELWLDIGRGRVRMFASGEMGESGDATVQRRLQAVIRRFEAAEAAMVEPGCDKVCQANAILSGISVIKRQLAMLQTHALKKDAEFRAQMKSAIQDFLNWIAKVSIIAVAGGAIFILYMYYRYNHLRKTMKELKKSHQRVVEVSNYRANFLAGMSHEFRTPLNAIKGFSQLAIMLGDTAPREQITGYMHDIERSANNLEAITDTVLDLSRIDAGVHRLVLEVIDLPDLFEKIISQFGAAGANQGRFTVEAPAGLQVACDRDSLRRCVDNLLSNAVKYSETATPILLRADRKGKFIVIEVVDQGRGIEKEEVEKVWRLYERSSYVRAGSIQGTGLGLALTKSLVEAHGGYVEMESKLNVGTTARLYFPAAISQGGRAAPNIRKIVRAA